MHKPALARFVLTGRASRRCVVAAASGRPPPAPLPSSPARSLWSRTAPVGAAFLAVRAAGRGVSRFSAAGCLAQADAAAPPPDAPAAARLRLVSAVSYLPHPVKASTGGEDASFVSPDGRSVGIADGVGGWAESGVDAGLFSRALMAAAAKLAAAATASEGAPVSEADAKAVLVGAAKQMTLLGSSTALVVLLSSSGTIAVANVGDSAMMAIRGGKCVFRTKAQQHSFNFPYQIATEGVEGVRSDTPQENAETYTFATQPGDVLVLGTDGLWDNVFDEARVGRFFVHETHVESLKPQILNPGHCEASDERDQVRPRPGGRGVGVRVGGARDGQVAHRVHALRARRARRRPRRRVAGRQAGRLHRGGGHRVARRETVG